MKYAELTKNKQCEELMMQTMHKMKDAFYKIYIADLSAVRAHLRLKEFSMRLVEGTPGASVVKTSPRREGSDQGLLPGHGKNDT